MIIRKRILSAVGCCLVAASTIVWTACDEESDASDDKNTKQKADTSKYKGMGPYGVVSFVGETAFLGILDSLTGGDYMADEGFEVDAKYFFQNADKLWCFPDVSGTGTDIEIYNIGQDNALTREDILSTPGGAKPTDVLFVSDDKAYLALFEGGIVWEINPVTREQTAEIDLTEYTVGENSTSPNPGGMAVKDGKLYVSLSQCYASMMMAEDGVYVAVIDMETNTVEQVIEDQRGFSYGGRPGGTGTVVFVDESGDLYLNAIGVGGWGFVEDQKGGFLRIKAGETEFDPDWEMDFAEYELTIDGETVTTDYLHFMVYAGDGIVYGTAHIPAHDSNPPDYVNDRNYSMVKVDLYNRTMEDLPLPATGAYASDMVMDGDLLVEPVLTDEGAGIWVYDPATGDAEKVIETNGPIGGIKKID
jgi:hypothetical protein